MLSGLVKARKQRANFRVARSFSLKMPLEGRRDDASLCKRLISTVIPEARFSFRQSVEAGHRVFDLCDSGGQKVPQIAKAKAMIDAQVQPVEWYPSNRTSEKLTRKLNASPSANKKTKRHTLFGIMGIVLLATRTTPSTIAILATLPRTSSIVFLGKE